MRANRKEYQNELFKPGRFAQQDRLVRPFDILERILTKHKGEKVFVAPGTRGQRRH